MRKTGIVFCIILLLAVLSSCGKYSNAQGDMDSIVIENTLPEAEGGAVSMSEIREPVYEQQIALCKMFAEAYSKTDIVNYMLKYPDLDRDKLISMLNSVREELNTESETAFVENIAILVSGVTNASNKIAYIQKCTDEVKTFLGDYRKFNANTEDRDAVISDIMRKYSKDTNELASKFLQDNREIFVESAIATIEANAETTKDFRANITKNNEIIEALNSLYGGVTENNVERVNAASKKLIEKLLNSMETLSSDERKQLMSQLNEGKELTLEKTPISGSSKTDN